MAADHTKVGNILRRRRPILSIRARLLILTSLVITPLVLERVHGLEKARAERTQIAHTAVMDLARRGAEAQRGIIHSTRALLQVVAHLYGKRRFDPADCSQALAGVTKNVPWLRTIAVAGSDGRISCATDPLAVGLNVSDSSYFQNAMASREFALSDDVIMRPRRVPGLIATFSVENEGVAANGVVIGSINLQWLSELAAAAAQRPGTSVLLVDSAGTLIAASADVGELVGKSFLDHALVRNMLASDEGSLAIADFAGVTRIFAYVRIPWTHAWLAVGFDESLVHSGIDRRLRVAYLQLALFGMLVLLAAWYGGERLIVRPVRSLVRTAVRFGRGDLHVRTSGKSWLAEFEPLAAAFDDMARKLAMREEDLRIANQHLDELANLDGLTGLANRRGFDCQLEREWRRARERCETISLIMIDIDYFKLYNDRYGHVAGDACLRSVGETLSRVTLESAESVARYGGEEFAALLPGLAGERARALADKACRAVADLLVTHAEAPAGIVTVSVGVASLKPEGEQPAADLVEAADRALYAAKRRGRNTVVAHAPLPLRISAAS